MRIAQGFRTSSLLLLLVYTIWLLSSDFALQAEQPPAQTPNSPTRLALLVGIQSYPKLASSQQLEGCRNDVKAMRALLEGRFGFQHEDVVTLVDQEATGAAICREMKRLVERI